MILTLNGRVSFLLDCEYSLGPGSRCSLMSLIIEAGLGVRGVSASAKGLVAKILSHEKQ